MDKARIAGAAKEFKGSVKQTVGKAFGDAELQADGRADKAEAKSRTPLGASRTQPEMR
jgi:uncharacterized protein YjbJ (UPF0337 family)